MCHHLKVNFKEYHLKQKMVFVFIRSVKLYTAYETRMNSTESEFFYKQHKTTTNNSKQSIKNNKKSHF